MNHYFAASNGRSARSMHTHATTGRRCDAHAASTTTDRRRRRCTAAHYQVAAASPSAAAHIDCAAITTSSTSGKPHAATSTTAAVTSTSANVHIAAAARCRGAHRQLILQAISSKWYQYSLAPAQPSRCLPSFLPLCVAPSALPAAAALAAGGRRQEQLTSASYCPAVSSSLP